MGRLIKNHWARLIILTAGACELAPTSSSTTWETGPGSPRMHLVVGMPVSRCPIVSRALTNEPHRSNMRCRRGFLLAKDLLGFRHQDAGPGREAVPDTANHQFGYRNLDDGVGVAAILHRRLIHPPEP